MKLKIATKYDLEVLLWLAIAPAGLCYTVQRLRGYSCWNSSVGKVFLSGNTIFWVLLIAAQKISFSTFLISNLVMFFIFLHTVGFYETYRSHEQRIDTKADVEMYIFHAMATIGISLIVFKAGREVACKLGNLLKVATDSCSSYHELVLWGAVAIELLTLIYVQAKNFFESALVGSSDELSRAMPFKQGHKLAFGFYLAVFLLAGLFW